MIDGPKKQLAHILWIGGSPDSGKSSVADALALRLGADVYHYDKEDAGQVERIGKSVPEVEAFLRASIEDRWLKPTPKALFRFLLRLFPLRFALVLESLAAKLHDRLVIVEGFGLLPELVNPVITSREQAIFFVPTEEFKKESMERRGKPSFARMTSDPAKVKSNLLGRDLLLADLYRKQAPQYGLTLYEIDGTRSLEDMTDLAEAQFRKYLGMKNH